MNFDLIHIFQEMGFFARCITGALAIMAVASLAVLLERLWALARAQAANRRFAEEAAPAFEARTWDRLADAAKSHEQGHLAQLVGAGLRVYLAAVKRPHDKVGPVELARRELERRTEAVNADLRRGFGVLASVGSVAPFIGLLGTVVGIIDAFQGISEKGSGGIGSVAGGIAEALVVTAIGLLVAIPAVLVFNYLTGRVDGILLALEQSRGEFLDHLEANHGVEAAHAAPRPVGLNGTVSSKREAADASAA